MAFHMYGNIRVEGLTMRAPGKKEDLRTAEKMSVDGKRSSQALPLVAGIDLGGTQIRVAILQGVHIRARVATLTGDDPTPERVLPRIYIALQQALDEAEVTLDDLAGI